MIINESRLAYIACIILVLNKDKPLSQRNKKYLQWSRGIRVFAWDLY